MGKHIQFNWVKSIGDLAFYCFSPMCVIKSIKLVENKQLAPKFQAPGKPETRPKFVPLTELDMSAMRRLFKQGLHRLEKYLNIECFLEKSMKTKSALKSTGESLQGLEKYLNLTIFCKTTLLMET